MSFIGVLDPLKWSEEWFGAYYENFCTLRLYEMDNSENLIWSFVSLEIVWHVRISSSRSKSLRHVPHGSNPEAKGWTMWRFHRRQILMWIFKGGEKGATILLPQRHHSDIITTGKDNSRCLSYIPHFLSATVRQYSPNFQETRTSIVTPELPLPKAKSPLLTPEFQTPEKKY